MLGSGGTVAVHVFATHLYATPLSANFRKQSSSSQQSKLLGSAGSLKASKSASCMTGNGIAFGKFVFDKKCSSPEGYEKNLRFWISLRSRV